MSTTKVGVRQTNDEQKQYANLAATHPNDPKSGAMFSSCAFVLRHLGFVLAQRCRNTFNSF
jgi:hypothetical protein